MVAAARIAMPRIAAETATPTGVKTAEAEKTAEAKTAITKIEEVVRTAAEVKTGEVAAKTGAAAKTEATTATTTAEATATAGPNLRKPNSAAVRWLGNIVAVVVLATSATALAGCMSAMRTIAVDVPPGGWSEPAELIYLNRDTLTVATVALTLRHSAGISPAAGAFRIARLSPWGGWRIDTVRIDIPPIVSRTGRLHETTSRAGERTAFSEPGEWRFAVTPLQRMQGVWSVAIELH